ncbi:MAG: glycosyltransferase family 2 protein [Bacteroidia bacterium]|nr:glycosyltransferase family 2 protein [Bacteroidia bacterium]MDW8088484.1 glycosyltransferase family 2 protein [Bacteroidia bacterium]
MRVIGAMILREGIRLDYPFREAICSALPLCEAFFVSVGQSSDGTKEALQALGLAKLHILDSEWDLSLREGGQVLAQETNKLLRQLPPADWVLCLQADEVLHEADYPALQASMTRWKDDPRVEGLLFDYLHFYGSYDWVGASRRWYRREVRIIRPYPDIEAYRDAQGFRRRGRKLWVKPSGGRIFHYGWVRTPKAQEIKFVEVSRFWHDDAWIARHKPEQFSYDTQEVLQPFLGTHPAVMAERIAARNWEFAYDPRQVRPSWKERLLAYVERFSGWRPGEFRNYRLLL